MRAQLIYLLLIFSLISCKSEIENSGKLGNITPISSSNPATVIVNEVPADQVEIQELKSALQATPEYQITTDEINVLEESDLLTPEDRALLAEIKTNN